MNREFLSDYAEDELFRQQEHYDKIKTGQITEATGYPDNTRFTKTNSLLVLCDTGVYKQYGEKIWSQIPFVGTLIIPLSPSTKENFLIDHSFDVEDIDKMIDLAKDKGRVQFVLSAKPTHYEGQDHLQSIFDELRPPILTIPWSLLEVMQILINGKMNSIILLSQHSITTYGTEHKKPERRSKSLIA